MARHVVHRRNGQADEYQELPDTEHLEPDSVTVTFPDGSLRSYHAEDVLGGVGFEFVQAGILVLRFEDSDHVLSAFAPTAWTSVSGTALGRPRPTILQRPLRSTTETAAAWLARSTVAVGARGSPQGNDLG